MCAKDLQFIELACFIEQNTKSRLLRKFMKGCAIAILTVENIPFGLNMGRVWRYLFELLMKSLLTFSILNLGKCL